MVSPVSSLTKHHLHCIEIDAPLTEAYALMRQKRIRHLPVKDGLQVIGIISDRDIQRGIRTEIFETDGRELIDTVIPEKLRVRQFMSWPLKTVESNLSIKAVTRRMIEEKISAFLVTENADVIGIVTHEDLLVYLDSLLSEEGERSPNLPHKLQELLSSPSVGRLVQTLANSGI